MATITSPKELVKHKDIFAVPREAYEEFLRWQKLIKSPKEFKPTAAEKRALTRGRKNYARGKTISLEQLDDERRTAITY